jgi:hypothetical protein
MKIIRPRRHILLSGRRPQAGKAIKEISLRRPPQDKRRSVVMTAKQVEKSGRFSKLPGRKRTALETKEGYAMCSSLSDSQNEDFEQMVAFLCAKCMKKAYKSDNPFDFKQYCKKCQEILEVESRK